jgi:hypothetical protein
MANLSFKEFENFFKYYKSEPQQKAGVQVLYEQMRDVLKDDQHDWVKTYRDKPGVTSSTILSVPFQSQNDNSSGSGFRECFSSSMAMVAMYYGKIDNDDDYNAIRKQYGDTTNAQSQVNTLKSLNLDAEFKFDGTTRALKDAIDAGKPVAVGWLFEGPVSSPSGSGHYSVIIGYDDDNEVWVVNDPNGEASLRSGGYTNNLDGAGIKYSYKNFNPRWIVEGEGSGWYMDVSDPNLKK